jgi:hypothetical protein
VSADHLCSLSADADRTFIFVSPTARTLVTAFHFKGVGGVIRIQRHGKGFHGNLDNMSPSCASYLANRTIHHEIRGLGICSFSCSFQLRATTTSRACRAMGQVCGSAASADYFDLSSRISVRHRPPVSGSFDRSTLELQSRRSSSPFCAIARSSTHR